MLDPLDPVKKELAKVTKERDEALAQRDRYRNVLFKRLVDDAANASITKHGGKPKILGILVTRKLAVKERNGRFEIVVIDADGTGKELHGLTLDSVVSDMRESAEYEAAFEAPTEKPLAKPKSKNNPWAPETFNATAQAKLIKEKPGLAIHLQREAGCLVGGVAGGGAGVSARK